MKRYEEPTIEIVELVIDEDILDSVTTSNIGVDTSTGGDNKF